MPLTCKAPALHPRLGCTPSTSGRILCYAIQSRNHAAAHKRIFALRALAGDDYAPLRQADEEYMKEYAAFKEQLLDNTRKSGAVVAAYLLLTVDGQAALCALLGASASYAYMLLLQREVDSYTADSDVPMRRAEQIENSMLRRVAKLAAGYQQALRPRLLVPVALAAAASAYNRGAGPEAALDGLHMACLLVGFLAYKGALLVKLVDDLTPKTFVDSASESRPRVEAIEDELDQWGRPRRKVLRMPTEALPEGVEPEKGPLAALILAGEEAAQAEAEGGRAKQQ